MNKVRSFDLENPWLFVFTNIVVWVVVISTVETIFFDGELAGAVITGAGGGLVSGITMFYLRKNNGI